MVEQRTFNAWVLGSIPSELTTPQAANPFKKLKTMPQAVRDPVCGASRCFEFPVKFDGTAHDERNAEARGPNALA